MRLADPKPPFCSACGGQYPELDHVDFEAAWDGPVLNPQDGPTAAIKVAIDDLIICERCMISALRLLDVNDVRSENEELGRQIEDMTAEILERDKMIADLQHSIEVLLGSPLMKKQVAQGGKPTLRLPKEVKNSVRRSEGQKKRHAAAA